MPLGLVTLYASEIEIKCDGGVYTPSECRAARWAYVRALGGPGPQRDGYQGCCSWHGGILGCDYQANRLLCGDRTLSPTCACPLRDGLVASAPFELTGCCLFGGGCRL